MKVLMKFMSFYTENLSIILFVLAMALLYICFEGYKQKYKAPVIFVDFILSILIIFLISALIKRDIFYINNYIGLLSFLYVGCGGIIIYVSVRIVLIMKFRKDSIDRNSIKESFDNLPAGICFADKNGIICLCNKQMHRISHYFLEHNLQTVDELKKAIRNAEGEAVRVEGESHVFRFSSGTLWRFEESSVTDEWDNKYTQIQAVDVTALFMKRKNLELRNRELYDMNERARKLYNELDRIVKEEETLSMKMALHDELGVKILSSQRLLEENCKKDVLIAKVKEWGRISDLFSIKEDEFSEKENLTKTALDEMILIAGNIGVNIAIKGDFPTDNKAVSLILMAMRECVTNIVRHAQGSELYVNIEYEKSWLKAEYTNNGSVPVCTVAEGGGLSGLRRKVERKGGTMIIYSSPYFKLTLFLPVEGREND